MALFFVLLAVAALLLLFYIFSTWNYNYWAKKGVVHPKPIPFFGNYKDYITLKKSFGVVADEICKRFPNEPYIGSYYGTEPALLVNDPELIKLILAKDFVSFNGREVTQYTDRETITKNMFFTQGDRWKVMRQNMTHLFTSSKIRNMFPLIEQCTHSLREMLQRETSQSKGTETRMLLARYTMDCIGSIAFGVQPKVMDKGGESNPFRKIGFLIFETSTIRGIYQVARSVWPSLFYGVGLQMFPNTIVNFFDNLMTDVFEKRGYKPSSRQDFVDLLLNLKQQDFLTSASMSKSNKGQEVRLKVDTELLVGQCVMFFAAGFETSASTSSATLYELAKNPEAQQRAAEEVDEYLRRHEGKIEYDCVTEMPYLEACIDEAMRMYPALGMLTREVMEDYTLPSGLKLEKGMPIHIPLFHLHHNPANFPEPYSYKPERFLPENKKAVRPYTYMPFGEGQRICLGIRVAKSMMLPALITILRNYRVELAPGMPQKVDIDPRAFVTMSRQGLMLRYVPRN